MIIDLEDILKKIERLQNGERLEFSEEEAKFLGAIHTENIDEDEFYYEEQ